MEEICLLSRLQSYDTKMKIVGGNTYRPEPNNFA